MPKKKLTESVRRKIKENPHRVKKSDYEGAALAYLNRVRGAAKARKAKEQHKAGASERNKTIPAHKIPTAGKKDKKKNKTKERAVSIKVGDLVIKPESEAYAMIAAMARIKKQSVAKFVKQNEKAITDLLRDYLIFHTYEIDALIAIIQDLPKKAKVFIPIQGKEIARTKAIFLLHSLKSFLLATAEVYEKVLIEMAYDLFGNVHVNIPYPIQYTRYSDPDELTDYLDTNFPNISYFKND